MNLRVARKIRRSTRPYTEALRDRAFARLPLGERSAWYDEVLAARTAEAEERARARLESLSSEERAAEIPQAVVRAIGAFAGTVETAAARAARMRGLIEGLAHVMAESRRPS